MSSRQEEKARRKAEREEAERKANATAARQRRLQIVGGVILGLAAVGAVVAIIASSGGGGGNGKAQAPKSAKDNLPPLKQSDLTKAAEAAGCTVANPPSEGREHTTSTVKYKTNPPTSGNHNPVPAEDGIYAPGNEPTIGHTVHSLEHGRIELQYAPGISAAIRNNLETLGSESFNGTPGYHVLIFQNQTHMPYQVAATAWTHSLTCKTFTPAFYDAFRDFRKAYTDKGPELIP